ncbi:MAG: hypothetical protein L3J67_03175 [Hyphomicrobiaceae bacterium]|nr:hypothetical protein [Hyphomicrobiaceae bacterium]
MKTSQYFIDDEAIQILFLDTDHNDARTFFENGLGNAWFDYELHLLTCLEETKLFLDPATAKHGLPDLLLISNRCWTEETEQLVAQIRENKKLACLPIYCVASCLKKTNSSSPQCWEPQWRIETGCDKDARITAIPFNSHLKSKSSAQLNGIICANNLDREIPNIIEKMTANWFCSG